MSKCARCGLELGGYAVCPPHSTEIYCSEACAKPPEDDGLDWNRLLAGDARALHAEHQPVFDMVARLREALERIAGIPDAQGYTHGARLHDVGAMAREARKALTNRRRRD